MQLGESAFVFPQNSTDSSLIMRSKHRLPA